MRVVKCLLCGKTLAFEDMSEGVFEIMCSGKNRATGHRCNAINRIVKANGKLTMELKPNETRG